MTRTMKRCLATAFAASWAQGAMAGALNLQEPTTPIATQIYSLHTYIMIVCVVIFVLVFGVMFYSIFKHRKSVGHKAAQFHESTTVELIWTLIPFLILMGLALPATKTVLAMKDTSNSDITIKAVGYQWKWGYEYIRGEGSLAGVSDGIKFYSNLSTPMDQIYDKSVTKSDHYLLEVDNPLVVPVGKKVRILTTANDVIHAFWVPSFGVKQDAIPGFIRDTWFMAEKTGEFRGQCAELCGKEHGFMPIVVKVVTEDEFKAWAAKQAKDTGAPAAEAAAAPAPAAEAGPEKVAKSPAPAGAVDGKKTFEGACAVCHLAGVAGAPKVGEKAIWAPRIAQGKDALYEHALKGKGVMPAKGGNASLSDADVKAAVDHMVSLSK
jgi:cytochrome c oxidase subunit II